jgi:hypothetical protein
MNRLEIDWAYLRLANRVLAEYILLPEIYRSLTPVRGSGSAGGLSQLALGNILLSLRRLQSISLSDSEKTELEGLCKQIEQVRDRWRANWERKARHELTDRLHLWQNYLKDLTDDKKLNSRGFPAQVRVRVIIYLLDEEIGSRLHSEQTVLDEQDRLLRSISSHGPFLWEDELADGFPEETCWFLYRSFE